MITKRLKSLLKPTTAESPETHPAHTAQPAWPLLPALPTTAASTSINLTNALQRALLQTFSLVVLMLVNVFYVYGLLFGNLSLGAQLVAEAALGLLKVFWQQYFVPYGMSAIAKNHDDAYFRGRFNFSSGGDDSGEFHRRSKLDNSGN